MQRTQRGMCLVWRGYGGDWDLVGGQALRADMGRHSEPRSSYLRRVCRSYGALVDYSDEMEC